MSRSSGGTHDDLDVDEVTAAADVGLDALGDDAVQVVLLEHLEVFDLVTVVGDALRPGPGVVPTGSRTPASISSAATSGMLIMPMCALLAVGADDGRACAVDASQS